PCDPCGRFSNARRVGLNKIGVHIFCALPRIVKQHHGSTAGNRHLSSIASSCEFFRECAKRLVNVFCRKRHMMTLAANGLFVERQHITNRENAAQQSSQAAKPPIRWLGGRAAVGGSNCTASRRLQLAPSESFVSRGSRRAAVRPAREAACSLE